MNADRKCENGRDAPVANEDFQKYAKQLTSVAREIYARRTKRTRRRSAT